MHKKINILILNYNILNIKKILEAFSKQIFYNFTLTLFDNKENDFSYAFCKMYNRKNNIELNCIDTDKKLSDIDKVKKFIDSALDDQILNIINTDFNIKSINNLYLAKLFKIYQQYENESYINKNNEFIALDNNICTCISDLFTLNKNFLFNEYMRLNMPMEKNYEISKADINNNLKINYSTQKTINETYDLIVAFTTYKPRIIKRNLYKMIDSILNQNFSKRFKIVMTIQDIDMQYFNSEQLNYLKQNNIEILEVKTNLRAHLKYFYVVQKYRTLPIVTVDDDCIYNDDLLQSLYDSYLKFPDCVSARRVHLIKWDSSGNLLSYNKWGYQYRNETEPSMNLFGTGVGGILYPPNILKISFENLSSLYKSLSNDDIYLKYIENILNIRTRYVPSKDKLSYQLMPDGLDKESSLCFSNLINNDICIKNLDFNQSFKKIKPIYTMTNIKKNVNIAYITDRNYINPTITSINSLIMNSDKNVNYNIFIICGKTLNNEFDKIKNKATDNIKIIIRNITAPTYISKMKQTVKDISKMAFIKFEIGNILKDIDKVLYIDGDTLILKDLYNLYNIDISNVYCACVKDMKLMLTYQTDHIKRLKIKHSAYFNSGVMLLNLDKIRKDDISNKMIDYRINGINFFMDQDTLNVVFKENVKYISPTYNFMASTANLFSPEDICHFYECNDILDTTLMSILNTVHIYHLTGIAKPWKMQNQPYFYKKYMLN